MIKAGGGHDTLLKVLALVLAEPAAELWFQTDLRNEYCKLIVYEVNHKQSPKMLYSDGSLQPYESDTWLKRILEYLTHSKTCLILL